MISRSYIIFLGPTYPPPPPPLLIIPSEPLLKMVQCYRKIMWPTAKFKMAGKCAWVHSSWRKYNLGTEGELKLP